MILSESTKKIMRLTKRIKVIQGGSSAGKTWAVLSLLILRALKSERASLVSVVSESLPHLKRGALRDFLKILQAEELFKESCFNRSNYTYHLKKWSFEFFPADSSHKLRGARRDILFINEANNLSYEAFRQLSIRTSKEIFIDFNPTCEFWAHTELLRRKQEVDFVKLTYRDNTIGEKSLLSENIIKEIESHRHNENWWRVYGLGEIGRAEGVIFPKWSLIDELPEQSKLLGYGLDFGFTNDPTALVGLYRMDGEYIYHQLIYQKGMTNGEIARVMKSISLGKSDLIIADSSEPKSIYEINNYGFSLKPCSKGKDSVVFGLQLMNEHPFKVTAQSFEMIRELRNYLWATDKDGRALNRPIEVFNHCIDAARYIATEVMKAKQKSVSLITTCKADELGLF